MTMPGGPNADQIRHWSEELGPLWVNLEVRIDAQIAPLGVETMERLAIAEGERVLDVGCGTGQSSLQLATRVGGRGHVLGVDVSVPMLERAERRAHEAGLGQLRFELADAQTHGFARSGFDVVFSRFGVMFFADPAAAFANLHAALRPGGRLGFVCWQAPARNPWVTLPMTALARYVEPPPPRPADAPGEFAFADAARVRQILQAAGFDAVGVESAKRRLVVGGPGTLDQAVEFLLRLGPAAAALRESGVDVRPDLEEALRGVLAPHHGPRGLELDAAAWIVTADRP